uniref:Soluble ligand binding domain-containing protein n=1 Tax=uncultured Armatimonadetes bacterium TaxID=157466 RepID=A0A6J4JIJ6_9BACT|nr:hypothetical protein AVDCRST_MAG63-3372 [uncultured Armatimonadetes bacterium]
MPQNCFRRMASLAGLILLTTLPVLGEPAGTPAAPPPAPAAPATSPQGVEILRGPIRVGDVVKITVVGDATVSGDYTVDSDGRVSLPIAGPLKVQGLQPVAAGDRVARFLIDRKVLRRPQVTLNIVARPQSVVYLSGALKSQGRTAIKDETRLSEVLEPAGTLGTSDLAKVVITRGNKEMAVNYRDFIEGKRQDASVNPLLRDGDRIFVYSVPTAPPVAGTYKVYGEVKTPQSFTLTEGATVGQALQQAGDMTTLANQEGIYIQRKDQRIPVPLKAIQAREPGADIALQNGDEVYVPRMEKPKFVSVLGAVRQPGQIPANTRLTLLEAVSMAGGPIDGAQRNKVKVTRVDASGKAVDMEYNIEKSAQVASVELQPNDVVDVPFPRKRQPLTLPGILGAVSSLFFFLR